MFWAARDYNGELWFFDTEPLPELPTMTAENAVFISGIHAADPDDDEFLAVELDGEDLPDLKTGCKAPVRLVLA